MIHVIVVKSHDDLASSVVYLNDMTGVIFIQLNQTFLGQLRSRKKPRRKLRK